MRRALISLFLAAATLSLAGCTHQPTPTQTEAAAAMRSPLLGRPAPAFELTDDGGQPVRLSDFRGRWLVLYFFPAADTPGCTCQANEFTHLLQRFHGQEADVLGVSPDTSDKLLGFRLKYGLQIRLAGDPTLVALRRYGAVTDYRSEDGNLAGTIVGRTTYLIDPQGRVAWHWPEVIPQGHAARVGEKLRELRSQQAGGAKG